jgi:hypothetical protein
LPRKERGHLARIQFQNAGGTPALLSICPKAKRSGSVAFISINGFWFNIGGEMNHLAPMKAAHPNSLLVRHLVVASFVVITAFFGSTRTASAQSVIYRETFYNTTNNLSFSNWGGGWNLYRSTNTSATVTNVTGAVNSLSDLNGRPTNLAAVNAGSYAGTDKGFAFVTATDARQALAFTTEYVGTNNLSTPNLTSISWYAANSSTSNTHQLAVQVGSQWYISDTTYTTANISGGNFSTQAELKTVNLSSNPTFRTLDFTLNSSAYTIGGTAAILPTGPLSAWGLFTDSVGSGQNNRFDTYEVQGFDAPNWAMVQTFTNGLGTTNASGTATVSGTINLTGAGGPGGNLFSRNTGAVLDIATNIVGNEALAINRNYTNTGGVTNSPTGTVRFSGTTANTYTNMTTVTAGTLELAKTAGVNAIAGNVTVNSNAILLLSASNQVADTSAVTLSGGTIKREGNVSEVFGNLNLTAASFLDYGSGATNTLRFGTYTPTFLLTVQNFAVGNKLQFGSTISTNDLANSSLFSFSNPYTTGTEGGFFTITAVPEPSAILAALGLIGVMLWPMRRHLLRRANAAGGH